MEPENLGYFVPEGVQGGAWVDPITVIITARNAIWAHVRRKKILLRVRFIVHGKCLIMLSRVIQV